MAWRGPRSRKRVGTRAALGTGMFGGIEGGFEVDASLLLAVVDQAPDAIMLVDPEGWVVLANHAACGLFGRDPPELVGVPVEQLMPERFREPHDHERPRFGSVPLPPQMEAAGRTPVRRPDGSEVMTELSLGQVVVPGRRLVVLVLHDVTARASEEERLRYLSTHDGLTDLYNRAFFAAEKSRLEAGRLAPISVAVIDVDDLKRVNDRYGHAAGDRHLLTLSTVMRRSFRAEDVVARLGGDEFVILLPGVEVEERDHTLERFLEDLHRHNETASCPVQVSVGVAIARRPGALTDAIREADERMYAAKSARRMSRSRALE